MTIGTEILALLTNRVLWTPVAAWLLAQFTKMVVASITNHEFQFTRLFGDGGMPSSHSAFVTSMAVMCGWCCGVGTPVFAVAAVLAFIVMHDAMGVRRETGKQAVTIRQLADAFNAQFLEKDKQIRAEKLKVLVGHNPYQILAGSAFGVLIAVLSLLLFPVEYASLWPV